MRNYTKRALSMLLCLALVFTFPMPVVFAADVMADEMDSLTLGTSTDTDTDLSEEDGVPPAGEIPDEEGYEPQPATPTDIAPQSIGISATALPSISVRVEYTDWYGTFPADYEFHPDGGGGTIIIKDPSTEYGAIYTIYVKVQGWGETIGKSGTIDQMAGLFNIRGGIEDSDGPRELLLGFNVYIYGDSGPMPENLDLYYKVTGRLFEFNAQDEDGYPVDRPLTYDPTQFADHERPMLSARIENEWIDTIGYVKPDGRFVFYILKSVVDTLPDNENIYLRPDFLYISHRELNITPFQIKDGWTIPFHTKWAGTVRGSISKGHLPADIIYDDTASYCNINFSPVNGSDSFTTFHVPLNRASDTISYYGTGVDAGEYKVYFSYSETLYGAVSIFQYYGGDSFEDAAIVTVRAFDDLEGIDTVSWAGDRVHAGTGDIYGPVVEDVKPLGNAQSPDGELVITFSEPIDIDASGTVRLTGAAEEVEPKTLPAGIWSDGDTTYTVAYTGLVDGRLYRVEVSGFKDIPGNAMATDSRFSFVVRNGETPRVFEHTATGIQVQGNFTPDATINILEGLAGAHGYGIDPACDAMHEAEDNGLLLSVHDITVKDGRFTGELTITIPVDTQHNGKTVTIFHCKNGLLETKTAIVTGGKVTFTLDSLSPIGIALGALNTPDTSWYVGHESDANYSIGTADELAGLAVLVNGGTSTFAGKTITLANDIDLSAYGMDYDDGKGWTSIGYEYFQRFNGRFDGGGHVIRGLYINDSSRAYTGLFGWLSGSVSNLGLEGVDITGGSLATGSCTGGIAGSVDGTIEACYVTGTLSGGGTIGGIVGGMDMLAQILHCYTACTVNCASVADSVGMAGGVIGFATGTVKYSYATGAVNSDFYGGGVMGASLSTPGRPSTNCVALNSGVTGDRANTTGRVAGDLSNSEFRNYALSTMPGDWDNSYKALGKKNGADIALETATTAAFWTTGANWGGTGWDTDVWNIQDGRLPTLKGFADTTPPTLTGGAAARTSDIAAQIEFFTDEAGAIYYLVQSSGVAAPSKETVKNSGSSLGAIASTGLTGGGVVLTAGAKDVYVVMVDASDNISDPLHIPVPAYNPVTAQAITGVTSPVTGATPSTAVGSGTGFTAALSWDGSPSQFAENITYTAHITLTASSGYTFHGVFEDTAAISGFTVNGVAPVWVSNNGTILEFIVTFPATAALGYSATAIPANKTFTAATYGYSEQVAQQFTVQNTGTGQITGLTATLQSGSSFEISAALSGSSVNAGNMVTVSVRPKTGLAANTYADTLNITGSNGISLSVPLSFTVGKATREAPPAPTAVGITATRVMLDYPDTDKITCMDNIMWGYTGVYDNLTPNTTYIFYQKWAETPNHYESPASEPLTVTTLKAALGGTVTISGDAKFGSTLTAVTTGLSSTPSAALGTLSYQWKRGTTNIGTNNAAYQLTQADIGATITVTITTANCTGEVTSSATAAVTKADGAAVSGAPALSGSPTHNSITVGVVTISVNPGSQAVEYAISTTSGSVPVSGWQSAAAFTGLSASTTYYVYARAAANNSYNAGTAQWSAPIATRALLGGTAAITGVNKIGQQLTVNTGSVTGGSGAFSYQWKAGTANVGVNAATYTLTGADAGKAITCVITRADADDSVTAAFDSGNTVPYSITVSNIGNAAGDTVVTLSGDTGRVNANITLNYVLGNGGGTVTNTLTFTGGTGLTAVPAAGASTNQNYTVQASDATNGVIAITATFQHTNLLPQSITFVHGNQSKVFGSGKFTEAATGGSGSGAITYTSSVQTVATVSNSGEVTIVAAGQTVITATKAADATYAAATVSYTLTVTNADQTAPSGIGKTDETAAGANNGTITGVNGTMEYKKQGDANYIVISGTSVTGLAPGSYLVRYAAKANYNAGTDATVTIAAYSAPTTYTITFNPNGGSVSTSAMQTGTDGKLTSLPTPTRSGSYSFDGWFTSASGGTQINTSTVFTTSATVYAHWTDTSGGSSGNGSGGSGGGGNSGSSGNLVIIDNQTPLGSLPEMSPPTIASTDLTVNPNKNGGIQVVITEAMVKALIETAEKDAGSKNKTADGIGVRVSIQFGEAGKSLTVTIEEKAIALLEEKSVRRFDIITPLVSFSFDTEAVKELKKQTAGIITLSVVPQNKLSTLAAALCGSRPVFDITISYQKSGKTEYVSSFGKGSVTLGLSYKPSDNEKTGNLYGVYVDKNGKAILLAESSYDSGKVIFSRNSLSTYGVGYKTPAPTFSDTANHWAMNDIDFVASRGLITGTSATTFSPNSAITRATFLMALGKLSGADVSGYRTSSFTDVKSTDPAMPYIEWAYQSKIVSGIGNNQFGPDHSISREDMAVMMQNYAKATGYTLPAARQTVTFDDNDKISAYAKDAVKAIQQTGIISGKPGNVFDPKGNATRAEAATILRRFVELVIDEGTARGWVQNDAGQWQYINANGKAVTGWLNITSGDKYYFDDKSIMVAGKWIEIDGKWYYFGTDGKLAVNTTIDGYKVGADGARVE